MKQAFAVLCLGACLALPVIAASNNPADQQLQDIYTSEWKWRLSQHLAREDDDNAIRAELPHVDPAAQALHLAKWQATIKQLDGVDKAALSPTEQINFAVYRAQIASLVDALVFREYEMPLNADSSFWTDMTYAARSNFKKPEDYRNFIRQLKDVPRYFAEQTANMRAGLARGFTPPRVTLQGRDATIVSVSEAKLAEDTVFYKPFKTMLASVPADEQARLRAEAVTVIRETVQPAYVALLKFMREDYVPKSRVALAAELLPDGKAYYQSKILEFTTTTLTPAQIHQIGLDEMAKIRAEMLVAMKQSGFTGDLDAFLKYLRSDPRFYAKTPEELLMRAAFIAKNVDAKLDRYFGYLPRRRFAIIEVPPDQAPYYTSGRGGPGAYYVNTYDLPSRALYSLPALTLHESAPGHAFQMPVAQEQKGLPQFRRAYISAFGEGWGLYSERLGSEMGIYTTPYETFGMLSYQGWRASRLVVDTGIHAMGWTRAQAQAYLHDNTALSEHEVETEVDRYISWPGQALSYYLGQMAIFKSRHKAEAALGAKFDLRAFHDTVLQLGSVPLPVLEARIDTFIADGGPSPYPK